MCSITSSSARQQRSIFLARKRHTNELNQLLPFQAIVQVLPINSKTTNPLWLLGSYQLYPASDSCCEIALALLTASIKSRTKCLKRREKSFDFLNVKSIFGFHPMVHSELMQDLCSLPEVQFVVGNYFALTELSFMHSNESDFELENEIPINILWRWSNKFSTRVGSLIHAKTFFVLLEIQ